jgi:hypothetical protein
VRRGGWAAFHFWVPDDDVGSRKCAFYFDFFDEIEVYD